MTDDQRIGELATRYGKGGDPSVYGMMKVAMLAERERCAKIAREADRDRHALSTFQGAEIAARILQE